MELKRYTVADIQDLYEVPEGELVYLSDVEREYIPRPDAEEARKAVLVLLSAKDSVLYFESVFGVYSDEAKQARDKLTEASNALLRLMGVVGFESVFGVYSDEAEQARDKLTEALNALLRLMGVE